MSQFNKPSTVSALDVAFGVGAGKLMPSYSEIPVEFKDWNSPWARWQSEWFYSGLKRYPVPKEGIDRRDAMAHLSAIQGSLEPKHEHKSAGVAYLASLWFSSPDGDPVPPKANKASK